MGERRSEAGGGEGITLHAHNYAFSTPVLNAYSDLLYAQRSGRITNMSTSSNSTKTAAKRRAAARRRNREILRQIFSYAIILILVLGTISTAVFVTNGSSTPASATPTPTSSGNQTVEAAMMQSGQQAEAKGDWASAMGFYASVTSMDAQNAEAHYRLGRAILNDTTKAVNYQRALDNLQQALQLEPGASWAADAQSLINKNQGKATPGAASTITPTTAPIASPTP